MPTLPIQLDRTRPEPLPAQLTDGVRRLMTDGGLRRGDRLPSSRSLARELGVSRATVEQAYDQLTAEGWTQGRRGAGTYVIADGRGPRRTPVTASTTDVRAPLVRLDAGTPWIDPRHAAGWRRAWREVSAATPPRGYDDPRGLPELRALLAERLARTRGLVVDPDDVTVTSGTTDGLRHLLAVLPQGPVVCDDPGYRAAVETVRRAGRGVRDHPATTAYADAELVGAAAVLSTPAHQHPLGAVLPAPDRVALLEGAGRAGALVVEDDYDSEFRYDVAPVPALAGLDRALGGERVAYLGTASKSVLPSLRLGWLVPPPALVEPVREARALTHDAASWPVQRAFVTLLRDGHLDRVVRSARRVYARRAPLVAAALSPYARAAGPVAGMYSTWLLPHDRALAAQAAARAAGFEVNLLADYARVSPLTGLVIGFGGVTDDQLERALTAVVAGLSSSGRSCRWR